MKRHTIAVDARLAASSGIGTYLQQVLPRVVSQLDDCRFVLLGAPFDLGLPRDGRVEFRGLRAGVYSIFEQPALAATIPRHVDVVWSPHYNIPLVSPGRLLVTVHDLYPLALAKQHGVRMDKRLYTTSLLRAIPRRADAIIAVSMFTAREIGRRLGGCRVHTIHNGVDKRWFTLQRRHRANPRPYLLYVGNVKPHKNIARMIRAFGMASRQGLSHDLLITGRREGFADPRTPWALPEAERVRFTGAVSAEELEQLVVHADGLVFVSLYEGFGLPPLEAMACGVPTLVSCVGAMAENSGPASLKCNPYDESDIAAGMVRLARDELRREELRNRGRDHARKFDWDLCAERTASVLRSLLD